MGWGGRSVRTNTIALATHQPWVNPFSLVNRPKRADPRKSRVYGERRGRLLLRPWYLPYRVSFFLWGMDTPLPPEILIHRGLERPWRDPSILLLLRINRPRSIFVPLLLSLRYYVYVVGRVGKTVYDRGNNRFDATSFFISPTRRDFFSSHEQEEESLSPSLSL